MTVQQHTLHAMAFAAAILLAGCGAGTQEQLAAGTQSGSSRQVAAPVSLDDADRLSAGAAHVVGLNQDGTVVSWGGNAYGQLGNGSFAASSVPVQVFGLSGVRAVQAGAYHTVAVRTDGTVWGWGSNYYGQLARAANTVGFTMPVAVPGISNVRALSAGQSHTSAVTNAGTVWGWGSLPGRASVTPVQVAGLQNVLTVVSGNDFILALKADGTVWGWGGNGFGQLGIGKRTDVVSTPVQVGGLNQVVSVSAGYVHALALRKDGSVWSWGSDTYGVLASRGGKPYTAQPVQGLPTPVNGASGVKAIAAGTYNSAILYTDGSVWAWGDNSAGQLGNGGTVNAGSPVRVNTVAGVVGLSIGDGFVSLITNSGTVYSIGANASGQLGNNTVSNVTIPVQVVGFSGIGYLNLGKSTSK